MMRKQITFTFPESKSKTPSIIDKYKVPIKVLDLQEQLDSPLRKIGCKQNCQFRKKGIKISKNKLPSDFFKSSTPSPFSSPQKQKTNIQEMIENDSTIKNQKTNSQVATNYDDQSKDQCVFNLKLTSCFTNRISQNSPQKQGCLTDRQHNSQKYDQNNKNCQVQSRSSKRRKMSFVQERKTVQLKNQIHLPIISSAVTPNLNKKDLKIRKLSDELNFHHNIVQINKKLQALLINSNEDNTPQKQMKKSRNYFMNTQQVSSTIDNEMIITFFTPKYKAGDFFQQ